jgi:hypothetical protein
LWFTWFSPMCHDFEFCDIQKYIYRVSQGECARLPENIPYVTVYRYNSKHLYPKLNGYGDNGQRKLWYSWVSTYCTFWADLNESFPNRWLHRGWSVAWLLIDSTKSE